MTYELDDEGMYQCPHCERSYETETSLKRHITIKHKPKEEEPPPDPVIEAIPELAIEPPKKEKKKKKKDVKIIDYKQQIRDSKKDLVKKTHQLWRKNPELAPKSWEDNKRGE